MIALAWLLTVPFILALPHTPSCKSASAHVSAVIRRDALSLQIRATGRETTWPSVDYGGIEGRLCKIPYCFANEETRTKARPVIDRAINLWYSALRGLAGPPVMDAAGTMKSGHSLVFVEEMQLCYSTGGVWNSDLDDNVLKIIAGKTYRASVGNLPGRGNHVIVKDDIAEDPENHVFVAHEVRTCIC
jgi:hypothetical protein